MRRLKLQMHVSLDGLVAARAQTGPGYFNWDTELRQYSISNAANVDYILLGRKTAVNFIPHWKAVADNPKDTDFEIGKVITDIPKVVFSKTLQKSEWPNATVSSGDIAESVNQLKKEPGKDMLVYGGSGFVASLIEHDLIDEYHLLVNPVALGSGSPIFSGLSAPLRLTLVTHKAFSSGTVLLHYKHS
jgi:dihydrofolate reductase